MQQPQKSWQQACLCSILKLLPLLSGMFKGCMSAISLTVFSMGLHQGPLGVRHSCPCQRRQLLCFYKGTVWGHSRAYLTSWSEFWIALALSPWPCCSSLLSASDMHSCLPVAAWPQDLPSQEGWDTVLHSKGEHLSYLHQSLLDTCLLPGCRDIGTPRAADVRGQQGRISSMQLQASAGQLWRRWSLIVMVCAYLLTLCQATAQSQLFFDKVLAASL